MKIKRSNLRLTITTFSKKGKKNALQDLFIPPSNPLNVIGGSDDFSTFRQQNVSTDDTNLSACVQLECTSNYCKNNSDPSNTKQHEEDNRTTGKLNYSATNDVSPSALVDTVANADISVSSPPSFESNERNNSSPSKLSNDLLRTSLVNPSTPTSSVSSNQHLNQTLNEFFKPEFLIIDMALTVGIDTAALETFELMFSYCKKHNVTLVLSGSDRHVNQLVTHGIFSSENHHNNLDTALEFCEDALLVKYQVNKEDETLFPHRLKWQTLSSVENGINEEFLAENEKTLIVESNSQKNDIANFYQYKPLSSVSIDKYDNKKGFLVALRHIEERHDIESSIMDKLKKLTDYVKPINLVRGEVIMDTTQGSVIDLDQDGLWFIEKGVILVERDVNQSTMQTTRTKRRIRQSVPPRIQRLKHRNFQLGKIGPGGLIGATELCSGYRSMGRFIVDSELCTLHFLSFRAIKDLEVSYPDAALNVLKLSSMLLADRFDRTREQLSQLFDTVYGPAQKISTATEKAMKKIRGSLSLQNNAIHVVQKKIS